ncbi:AAA family ATPase [Mollicutes bacterium LVI A0039]|nr:AAA family ATPase [Mollicutes bacterium LVI A0039]
MIFNKLILNNYRQYKNVEFNFNDKLNLIEGANGIGKSTFMSAIIFALYGLRQVEKSGLLENVEYLANLDTIVFNEHGVPTFTNNISTVTLYIEVNSGTQKKYEITRSLDNKEYYNMYRQNAKRIVHSEYESVEVREISTVDKKLVSLEEITMMLPENIAPLLFFDGERIKSIQSVINSGMQSDFKDEVERILQISRINSGKLLIKNAHAAVINKISKQIDKEEVYQLQSQKDQIETTVAKYEQEVKELEEKNQITVKEQAEITRYLQEHEESKRLQEKRSEIENQKKMIKDNQYELKTRLMDMLCKEGSKMALTSIFSKLYDKISQNADIYEIGGIEQRAITDIISNGTCICGNCITDGMKQHLVRVRETLPPESFEAMLKSELTHALDVQDEKDRAGDLRIKYYENDLTLVDLDSQLKDVSNKILDIDTTEIKNKEQRHNELELIRKADEQKLYELCGQIRQLEIQLSVVTTDLNKIQSKEETNELDEKVKKALSESVKIADVIINNRKSSIREQLEQRVNENANLLLRDNLNIKLDAHLKPKVKYVNGTESSSSGQNVMISLSYLLGLMQIAKDQHESKNVDDLLYPNIHYPMVMDGVTATLDIEHIGNMVNSILDVDSQVIFLVNEQTIIKLTEALCKKLNVDSIEGNITRIFRDVDKNETYIEAGK